LRVNPQHKNALFTERNTALLSLRSPFFGLKQSTSCDNLANPYSPLIEINGLLTGNPLCGFDIKQPSDLSDGELYERGEFVYCSNLVAGG